MTGVLLGLAGLTLLAVGSEVLVRSGSSLAAWYGIRPMVIGLTVVSVGTSAPELAIGVDAVWSGSPDIATGNIIGTNLVNLLLVLGVGALIRPLTFDRPAIRFDLPAVAVSTLLLYLLARDGELSRVDGVLLCLAAVGYTIGVMRSARKDARPMEETESATRRPARQALALLVSLVVIVGGAQLLVQGAADTARALGVSEAVIALTIVAVGTSAPELVTMIVATLKGQPDVAVGNIVGSTVYNIVLVLGVAVLVAPGSVTVAAEIVAADLVLLVVATGVTLLAMLSGARLTRLEGLLLVAGYGGYLAWLVATRL